MDTIDVKNLLLRLQSIEEINVLKLDRDTIHREMKQPAPGLSPALKDWITLVMKKDLLLSKEDEPAILSDDGTISDEKVNGFTQRKQLESLMTDVIDAILLPKDGMSAAFRSPGEAAISPDLLHHQVKPTWVKDLNVLVEEWIKQPSWRGAKNAEIAVKGVSSVPKPLDIEDMLVDGEEEDGEEEELSIDDGVSESSQKEEELCECCSKVKTRHHHHPLAFPPIVKSLIRDTPNRFLYPRDHFPLLLSLQDCFNAARPTSTSPSVPTKLENEVRAYNEKLRRLAGIQVALRKSKVDTAWFCTRGVMEALEVVDTDRRNCVGVSVLGRALKALIVQVKSFDEMWGEGTEKFVKTKKKKGGDEPGSAEELDALWEKFIDGMKLVMKRFREEVVGVALQKVGVVIENLGAGLNDALGKVETSALALGLSVEEQRRVKECVEPGRHGLGVVTKMVGKCVEAYEVALGKREEELFKLLEELDKTFKEESTQTVRGRLEKAANRDFRRRIKDVEAEFGKARVQVVSEMAGSVCPLSPIAVIGAVVLQASLGLGNLLDRVAYYESAELVERAMKKEGLMEERRRLKARFGDGVRRGRAELNRVVGVCLVKEARRRVDETMLEMELRKLEERKAGQIDGDDGGKKKKPKKKKSKAKTLGGDDMEDEDVTERPPSALSMAPKETKKSGGKNAVEATSIAPAHSPQHSLEKANGAGVKQGKTAAAAVKPVVIAGDVAPLDRPSITKATPVSEISSKAPSSAPFEEKSSKEPSRTVPLPSSAAVPTAPTTAAAIPPANQTATPSKKKGGKKDAKKVTKPSDPAVPTPFKQETPVSAEEKVTEPAVLEPTATPIEPAVLELTATSIEPALNDRVFTEPTDSTAQSDTQTFLDNNPLIYSLRSQVSTLESHLRGALGELNALREENKLLYQQTNRAAEEAERWKSIAMALQTVSRPPSTSAIIPPTPTPIAFPQQNVQPTPPGQAFTGLMNGFTTSPVPLFDRPPSRNGRDGTVSPPSSSSAPAANGGATPTTTPGPWDPVVTAALWSDLGLTGATPSEPAPTPTPPPGFASLPSASNVRMGGLPPSLDSIWAPPSVTSPSASPLVAASVLMGPPGLTGGPPPGMPSRSASAPNGDFGGRREKRGGFGRFSYAKGAGMRCGNCGDSGHESGVCHQGCRYCDKKDHLSDACPSFA